MRLKLWARLLASAVSVLVLLLGVNAAYAAQSNVQPNTRSPFHATTPIKHLVVIFQENVSFDHYFATYPNATNPAGEPAFYAAPDTPTVNGLTQELLTNNPNLDNPKRLDRAQALTCDQDHGYTAEQQAFDHGLMDKFVQSTA